MCRILCLPTDDRCHPDATELTVSVTAEEPLVELTAIQASARLEVEQIDQQHYLVSINPNAGPTTLAARAGP
jgi:hypothetical protein